MADLDYIKNRIREMSLTSMISAANSVHNRSNVSTVHALFDIAKCGIKYSAGYTDYLNNAFETKTPDERRETITRGVNNAYVRKLNSPDLDSCFNDKRQLYALYRDFISRDIIDIEKTSADNFRAFVGDNAKIVVRKTDAKGNDGTFVLNLLGVNDFENLRERLLNMGLSLAERLVTQHREMERLCGESVAVIRVVTVNNVAVFACLNSVCGKVKLTAPINEKTGVITSSAVDEQNGMFHRHPLTDRRFYGFKIPLWHDVISLAERASLVLSSVKYCGFDIAVLPDKPELIDATSFPRHDYYRVCDNSVLRRKIEQRISNEIN